MVDKNYHEQHSFWCPEYWKLHFLASKIMEWGLWSPLLSQQPFLPPSATCKKLIEMPVFQSCQRILPIWQSVKELPQISYTVARSRVSELVISSSLIRIIFLWCWFLCCAKWFWLQSAWVKSSSFQYSSESYWAVLSCCTKTAIIIILLS